MTKRGCAPSSWRPLPRRSAAPRPQTWSVSWASIMTAHVVYPAIDRRPATLSRRWLTEILRGELGFAGVILSDDLDMKALQAENLAGRAFTLRDGGDVVVESLLAGCDAFLLCRDPDRQARAEEALRRAAHDRPEVRARLIEACSACVASAPRCPGPARIASP